MTFEEFITKKKIDLVQFEKDDTSLFYEFKKHFEAMGEKSFDHTKKFLFNKLRRLYHLTTPTKAVTQVETAIASQSEPLSSPTMEQGASPAATGTATNQSAKPAFRPRNIPAKPTQESEAENVPTTSEASGQPVNKPAFRPRNIPAKPVEESTKETTDTSNTPIAPKPGFKPRNIPVRTEESNEKPEAAPQTPASAKPGFKPRNIPSRATDTPDGSQAAEKSESTEKPKTPGFKPRNIKPAAAAADAQSLESRPGQTEVSKTPLAGEKKAEEAAPEQGYMPKFKMRNIVRNSASSEEQTSNPGAVEAQPESSAGKKDESVTESGSDRNTSPHSTNETPGLQIPEDDTNPRESKENLEQPEAKPAYKPKFNLRNIKKQNPEE